MFGLGRLYQFGTQQLIVNSFDGAEVSSITLRVTFVVEVFVPIM